MKNFPKIANAVKEKRLVKIYRHYTEEELINNGFVLNSSDEFILIQNESDFLLDGYSIIKISDIGRMRYGKYEKYFEMMFEKEEIKSNVGIEYSIILNTYESIFKSIMTVKSFAIVECQKKNDGRFIIGQIEEIKKKSVGIRYFDATGVLKKKLTKLKYKDITTIQFDSRYVNIFSKYLRTTDRNSK